jgi:hypothetical protein
MSGVPARRRLSDCPTLKSRFDRIVTCQRLGMRECRITFIARSWRDLSCKRDASWSNTNIDKSTLQSLSVDEAKWLSHHFHPNLIEPLFVEIVGALTATDRRDPVADVATLAKKMLGMGLTTTPNMCHRDLIILIIGNLLGVEFNLDGRIVLHGAQPVPQEGNTGIWFLPEPPEIEALRRLAKGKFVDREKEGAVLLRNFVADVDLRRIREVFEAAPSGYRARDLHEVLAIVDKILDGRGRYDSLRKALDHLHISSRHRAPIVTRWKLMGGPPFKDFAPYAYYVLRVEEAHPAVPGWSICSMRVPCAGDQRRARGDIGWLGRDR